MIKNKELEKYENNVRYSSVPELNKRKLNSETETYNKCSSENAVNTWHQ